MSGQLLGIVAEDDDDGHAATAAQAMRPAKANGNGAPKKKPIKERTDKELLDLRKWAAEQDKPDLIDQINEELDSRRETVAGA